jgi:hypothetical protein
MMRWYEHDPRGTLVGEAELRGVSLQDLQRLFNVGPDDPMWDCYRVCCEHVPGLLSYLDVTIELERYSYFVEAEAVD